MAVPHRQPVAGDAGVFAVLMEAMIAEAARCGQVDLSLVSVGSTSARAHQDAAGKRISEVFHRSATRRRTAVAPGRRQVGGFSNEAAE